MKLRGYIVLIQSLKRIPLTEREMKNLKTTLGPHTQPLMAWGTGAAIGFISAEGAVKIADKIAENLGTSYQISVLELGEDHSQYGTAAQNDFMMNLRWYLSAAKGAPEH